jgi:hypothetical protein
MLFIIGPVETIACIEDLLIKKIDPVNKRNICIDKRLFSNEASFVERFKRKNKFGKQQTIGITQLI